MTIKRPEYDWMKALEIPFQLAAAVLVGGGMGYWLDTRLGTSPWLMLFFLLAGIGAGLYRIFVDYERLTKDE